MAWLDLLACLMETVSGVDFNDTLPRRPRDFSKVVAVGLVVLGGLASAILFALTTDMVLRKRIDLALGRRKYTGSGHVIVCGLGTCGHRIVEELLPGARS